MLSRLPGTLPAMYPSSICRCTHLPIHLSTYPPIHLFITHPSTYSFIHPSVHLPKFLSSTHSSIHSSIRPHPFIHPPIHLSILLPTHPFIHSSTHSHIHSSILLPTHPSIRPSPTHLPICLLIHPPKFSLSPTHPSTSHPSTYTSFPHLPCEQCWSSSCVQAPGLQPSPAGCNPCFVCKIGETDIKHRFLHT